MSNSGKGMLKIFVGYVAGALTGGSLLVGAMSFDSRNLTLDETQAQCFITCTNDALGHTDEQSFAAAIAQNPSKSPAELAILLTSNADREAKNVPFTPDMVERIKRLQELEFLLHINILRNRPSNKRLEMLVNETERYLARGDLIQAETTLERINNELTKEQRALIHEAHVRDHEAKIARGEYSIFEDWTLNVLHNPGVATSAQARELTLKHIKQAERDRQYGMNQSAPRVDFRDFGIEGFDIDPFEIDKKPLNMPKPPILPSTRTTPQDLRGRR